MLTFEDKQQIFHKKNTGQNVNKIATRMFLQTKPNKETVKEERWTTFCGNYEQPVRQNATQEDVGCLCSF